MSDQENGQSAAGDVQGGQPIASPGAQLAGYREERGWTIEQVASQLNLAPRQIAAIENDDYQALPGMPIARGFIRAYAKLLKVDATPLLAAVGGETPAPNESLSPRKTLSTPFSEARVPSMMERPGLSSKWVIGLLLALLLGVAIWAAQQGGGFPQMPTSATSQVANDAAKPSGSEGGSQQAANESAAPGSQPAPADGTGENAVAPENVTPADASVSMAAPAQSGQAAAPSVETPIPAADNALVLTAHEESWVEIRRADGNGIVFSRLMKAGEKERIEVTEPLSIVIGNSAGVDATLRGAAVELKSTKSNVARLSLK